MCRERCVAEGLDEEDGGVDVSVEDGEFVLVVDFTSAIPVDCLCCVSREFKGRESWGVVSVRGPVRPFRENSLA